jgi:hypothetical protein
MSTGTPKPKFSPVQDVCLVVEIPSNLNPHRKLVDPQTLHRSTILPVRFRASPPA